VKPAVSKRNHGLRDVRATVELYKIWKERLARIK
jgi:hypothetical protein